MLSHLQELIDSGHSISWKVQFSWRAWQTLCEPQQLCQVHGSNSASILTVSRIQSQGHPYQCTEWGHTQSKESSQQTLHHLMTWIYTFCLHISLKTILARVSIPYNKGCTNLLLGLSSFAWFNGKSKVIRQQASETIACGPVIWRAKANLQWEKWKQPQAKRSTNHDTNQAKADDK